MNRKRSLLAVWVVMAVVAGGAALAEEQVWVSAKGDHHVMAKGHAKLFASDGEVFDVSELADGETRVFGRGEKQITATRDGDEVLLSRSAADGEDAVEIVCALESDSCRIITIGDEPDKLMIAIEKRTVCEGGETECDVHLSSLHHGEGEATILVQTVADCSADVECEHAEEVVVVGSGHHGAMMHSGLIELLADGDDAHFITVESDGGEPTKMLVRAGNKVHLRCPEGDATMVVDKDEADETYLCPKHSVPMERATMPHKIRIETE